VCVCRDPKLHQPLNLVAFSMGNSRHHAIYMRLETTRTGGAAYAGSANFPVFAAFSKINWARLIIGFENAGLLPSMFCF
jgi:hypothetical protein